MPGAGGPAWRADFSCAKNSCELHPAGQRILLMENGAGTGHASDTPLVSVVVPFYNHEHFVDQTMGSILSQDYPSIQVVAGDDASKDGTGEKLQQVARAHPGRVEAFSHAANLGIAGNLNFLLNQCRGRYIAFLGGDDLMNPGRLKRQIDLMEARPEVSLCYTNAEVFDSDTGRTLSLHNAPGINPPIEGTGMDLIIGNVICSCAATIRASAVPEGGFNPLVPTANDWLFFIEVGLRGRIAYIPDPLSRYRRHSGNITRARQSQLREEFQVMDILEEKYDIPAGVIKLGRAHVYARMAREEEFAGHYGRAAALMRQALAGGVGLRLYTLLYAVSPRLIHFIRGLKSMTGGASHWSRSG